MIMPRLMLNMKWKSDKKSNRKLRRNGMTLNSLKSASTCSKRSKMFESNILKDKKPMINNLEI